MWRWTRSLLRLLSPCRLGPHQDGDDVCGGHLYDVHIDVCVNDQYRTGLPISCYILLSYFDVQHGAKQFLHI